MIFQNLYNKKELINKLTIKFFFIIFLIVGVFSVKDYGISYDELEYRQQGFIVLNDLGEKFFPEKTQKIKNDKLLKYPSFNEYFGEIKNNFKIQHTIYAAIEYVFQKNNNEKKEIYLLRHYLNFFVFFISIFYFYKLSRIFFSRNLSLVGILFYFLTPRIFANSFYNPNDIYFLVFLLISVYYGIYFLKKDKPKHAILLAFFISLAFNVRVIGVYFYLIFVFFYILRNKFLNKNIKFNLLILQFFLIISFLYLLTPQLWSNPIHNFFNIFFGQLGYSAINPKVLFMGIMYEGKNLPWYYLIYWIFISSPLIILILATIGFGFFLKDYKNVFNYNQNYLMLIIIVCLICPLFAFIIFKPIVYNGWRQFYFIWPFILILSVYGLDNLQKIGKRIYLLINLTVLFSIIGLCFWNIKNHPYQNIFFNHFARKDSSQFEKDYWGLSNTNALRNILKNENKESITIKPLGGSRIDFAINMLTNRERERIKILKPFSDTNPDYYMTTYNDGNNFEDYSSSEYLEVESILVDNFKINTVFKKDF